MHQAHRRRTELLLKIRYLEWRPRPELNWCTRFCSSGSALPPRRLLSYMTFNCRHLGALLTQGFLPLTFHFQLVR